MQIPILSGIAGNGPGFDVARPVNLTPYITETGISKGFFRSAAGIVDYATGPGLDRGGILWNGTHYRVMGTALVSVGGGTVTTLGDVGNGGPCVFTYSFDRLAIASGGRLYYWDGAALAQVTDPDLGIVEDVVWVDGYFMFTDGVTIGVTDLNDPFAVNPLRYGSSEGDPDRIVALFKGAGEVYALNRNTIEAFQNVGGTGFPFARVDTAMIQKGVVARDARCAYLQTFAFVGSGRGEQLRVYLAGQGVATPISDRNVDDSLAALNPAELALLLIEARIVPGATELLLHLPNVTLVYHPELSQQAGEQIWTELTSSPDCEGVYRLRRQVLSDEGWIGGDPLSGRLGRIDTTLTTHYGTAPGWRFDTPLIYNDGAACELHSLELVGTFGIVPPGIEPRVFHSWTINGRTWSQERSTSLGTAGQYTKRPVWLQNGIVRNWRGLRFRGLLYAPVSFARLEAQIEALAW